MSERIPLADNPLFDDISEDETKRLNDLAREIRVIAGTELVEQGDIGRRFMLIVEGACDVLVDGEVVAKLGPGDFFGEMALLGLGDDGFHRSATVVATEESILEVMLSYEFDAAIGQFPEAADVIRKTALKRQTTWGIAD